MQYRLALYPDQATIFYDIKETVTFVIAVVLLPCRPERLKMRAHHSIPLDLSVVLALDFGTLDV